MQHSIPWLTAIVLAVVQGATEFIPVSSSAHLVIGAKVLGTEQLPLAYAVTVHVGTLVAVVVHYRRDLWQLLVALLRPGVEVGPADEEKCQARRLFALLLVATVPAAVAGLLAADYVDRLFSSPLPTGLFLLVTALFLWLADRQHGDRTPDRLTWIDSVLIGIGQMIAILPGVSRSGTTVLAGLWRGLSPAWAPRFSFLLSVPIIAGAGLVEAGDLATSPLSPGEALKYGVAGLLAAGVGYASIYLVVDTVRRGSLFKRFGIYCLALAVLTVAASLLGYW
ncbi:MAG: undecaprenyl-diphosphate phosphatase [Armatimonadetes bacterium]|nr:undecaprenyl-diphosphate phosphatase [Armatimonadota bacterium]